MDRAEGRAPADYGEPAARLAEADVLLGNRIRDAEHLVGADVGHRLVVLRRIIDVAGADILLDAADAVHQPGRPRLDPDPGELAVTGIGIDRLPFPERLVVKRDLERLVSGHVRHAPRLG